MSNTSSKLAAVKNVSNLFSWVSCSYSAEERSSREEESSRQVAVGAVISTARAGTTG
jgi:hypothetical protein